MSSIWKKGKEKWNWKHWPLKPSMELKRGVELAGCCLESSLWGACVSLKVILRRLSVLNPDQKRDQVRHAVDDPFLRSYKNRVSMEPESHCRSRLPRLCWR